MSETSNNLTPCERLGYKVGDRFKLKGATSSFGGARAVGATIVLINDDDSEMPRFQLEEDPSNSKWVHLCNVKKLQPTKVALEEAKQQAKNKAKEKAQLVFTYTNGKKFVVRGLKNVYTLIVKGVPCATYIRNRKT